MVIMVFGRAALCENPAPDRRRHLRRSRHTDMARWNCTAAGLLLFVFLICGEPAIAQEPEVGVISRIKEQKKEVATTQRAQIWRVGEGGPARRQAPLRDQDIVRIGRQVFLDLDLFGEELESRIVLGTRTLAEQGAYEIRQNTVDELAGLELVVRQGVLVVEHTRGRLTTVAAGIRTRIFGTTVLIAVDDDGEEAHLYLPEGHIGFPEWEDLQSLQTTGEARSWRLRQGQRPEELTVLPDAQRRWAEELRHNTQSVWRSTPFWQQPRFLIPAGIALVGAGILVFSGSSETATGRVVVGIP